MTTYSIASLVVSAVCFLAAYVLRRRKAAKQLKTQETAWDEFRPLEADLPQVVDWATFHERVWDRTRMTVCDNHNVTKLDGGWYVFDGLAHQKVPSSVTLAEALSMFDNIADLEVTPPSASDAQEPEPQSDAESPAPSADHVATSNVWANWAPTVYGVNWSTLDSDSGSLTVSLGSAAEGSTRDPVAEPEGETRCPVAEFAEGDWALSQHGTVYQVGPFSGAARGTLLRRAADGFVVGDEVRDEHGTNYLVEMHGEAPKGEWAGGPAVGNERLWRHSWAPVLLNPVQLTSPWVGRRVHTGSGESQLCVWADQDTLTLSDGSSKPADEAELHWDDVRVGDRRVHRTYNNANVVTEVDKGQGYNWSKSLDSEDALDGYRTSFDLAHGSYRFTPAAK